MRLPPVARDRGPRACGHTLTKPGGGDDFTLREFPALPIVQGDPLSVHRIILDAKNGLTEGPIGDVDHQQLYAP
jgi:hypothetical protein